MLPFYSISICFASFWIHSGIEVFNPFALCYFFVIFIQVDYYTTESVVSVDWENGFVEASAKENENVNKVIFNRVLVRPILQFQLRWKDRFRCSWCTHFLALIVIAAGLNSFFSLSFFIFLCVICFCLFVRSVVRLSWRIDFQGAFTSSEACIQT